MSWYVANTSNGQGLVVDEDTGENIAVTYNEKDANLVASSPNMKKALENALACLETLNSVLLWNKEDGDYVDEAYDVMREIREALE